MKNRNFYFLFAVRLVCVVMLVWAFAPIPTKAAGICGTGSWQSGNLEIHHINIGQGDATLIVGPTGKSLLFDAGESHLSNTLWWAFFPFETESKHSDVQDSHH